MTNHLIDKSVLITGGAIRVGAAMAKALAADGWHVIIHYYGSSSEAEALLAKIRSEGNQGSLAQADLRNPNALMSLISSAQENAPPLKCLINNASLFENDAALNMTLKTWDDHHAVNLRAPVFLARDFAQNLVPGMFGIVINLLDNKMFALNPDFFSYTIAKFGLLGATKVLAMELAPQVRVCGIAPGITLPSKNQTQEGFQVAHKLNPLEQGSTLEQLVATLRFILSSPALTGEVITIDGGQSLLGMPRDVSFMAQD